VALAALRLNLRLWFFLFLPDSSFKEGHRFALVEGSRIASKIRAAPSQVGLTGRVLANLL